MPVRRGRVGTDYGDDSVIYCGRPGVFGNPFVIGETGTREEVISLYRKKIWDAMYRSDGRDMDLMRHIFTLADRVKASESLVLTCWCEETEACHVDELIGMLEYIIKPVGLPTPHLA